jgi:cysteine synthase A
MKVAKKLTDLIGNTPLMELGAFAKFRGAEAPIIAKLEHFNPLGSLKDRVALAMIEEAERKGLLKPGSVVIEPTSGNAGIGLAYIASVKGYRMILTMPKTMSLERRNMLKALGAELVLTPGSEWMKGAIEEAKRLHAEIPNSVLLQQFENQANPDAHYATTANEIWRDTDGNVDIFVCGAGTCGTISGVGRRLKELKPGVQIVGVEPAESAVLSGGKPGVHKIQGIGAGFIPKTYDPKAVDLIFPVSSDDAIRTSRQLAKTEGLLVGIAAGAATHAAVELSKRPENKDKNIVVILGDTGERYLSTVLYAFDEYPL